MHLVVEYVGGFAFRFLILRVFTCWNPSWLEVGWNMAGLQTWWEKEIKNFLNNNIAPSQLLQREEGKRKERSLTCPPASVVAGLGDGVEVDGAGKEGGAGGGATSSG